MSQQSDLPLTPVGSHIGQWWCLECQQYVPTADLAQREIGHVGTDKKWREHYHLKCGEADIVLDSMSLEDLCKKAHGMEVDLEDLLARIGERPCDSCGKKIGPRWVWGVASDPKMRRPVVCRKCFGKRERELNRGLHL